MLFCPETDQAIQNPMEGKEDFDKLNPAEKEEKEGTEGAVLSPVL